MNYLGVDHQCDRRTGEQTELRTTRANKAMVLHIPLVYSELSPWWKDDGLSILLQTQYKTSVG